MQIDKCDDIHFICLLVRFFDKSWNLITDLCRRVRAIYGQCTIVLCLDVLLLCVL